MPKPGCWDSKYNQTEVRKEQRRIESILRSRRNALMTTAKRIKDHSIDDLIEIARICCQDNAADFTKNQDAILFIFKILHGAENVQSELPQ